MTAIIIVLIGASRPTPNRVTTITSLRDNTGREQKQGPIRANPEPKRLVKKSLDLRR